ncbi:MAG: EcsC family protein [Clostridia bacterium]
MFKTPLEKQWDKIMKQETDFLKKSATKKSNKVDEFLSEKVPDKLQGTLNTAFSKSFSLIFDKGTTFIEKSYNKEEEILKHKVNMYAYNLRPDNKRLRRFETASSKSQAVNVAVSGAKGVGLGLLGIGLPDIPIFIGMILKGIYEIALRYGYEYDTEAEQYYILSIIAGSLSYGDSASNINAKINSFIVTEKLPDYYDKENQIRVVSNVLSTELLCMKFLQGLPVVGVVGGVADAVFVNKILAYAKLKYKRRFLYRNITQRK